MNTIIGINIHSFIIGSPEEGLDYYKTFTLVIKLISYKLLFTIIAANDLKIK